MKRKTDELNATETSFLVSSLRPSLGPKVSHSWQAHSYHLLNCLTVCEYLPHKTTSGKANHEAAYEPNSSGHIVRDGVVVGVRRLTCGLRSNVCHTVNQHAIAVGEREHRRGE